MKSPVKKIPAFAVFSLCLMPCLIVSPPTTRAAVETSLEFGQDLFRKKQYKEAAKIFREMANNGSESVQTYVEWARALIMDRKRAEGLKVVRDAFRFARTKATRDKLIRQQKLLSEVFFTNETFQLYQTGLNLLQVNKISDAIQSFEKSMAKEPDNVAILKSYGLALQLIDSVANSRSILKKALELNNNHNEVRYLLGRSLFDEKPERTVDLIREMAIIEGNREDISLLYAKALAKTGQHGKAVEHLRGKIQVHKERVLSTFWLAKTYAQMEGGTWLARKFFMTFIRRTKNLEKYSDQTKEAEVELEKLERKLEIKNS